MVYMAGGGGGVCWGEVVGTNGMDLIMDGWFHERGVMWPGQAMSLKVEEVVYHGQSEYQDILVLETSDYGRVLVLDGVINLTERDEFTYQEMMAHVPLFAHPNPERVLIIGGGDGGVIREVAKHPSVKQIRLCDIDKGVIDAAKKYLPFTAVGFDDPRVEVKIMDGALFMEQNQRSFDVIITDSSDPVGPASVLFETPFYNAMYDSLKDGGLICTQGECQFLHLDIIQPLIQAISNKYSTVEYATVSIPTYPSGQIGLILATKNRDPSSSCQSPQRLPTPYQQKQFQYYTPQIHQASFVLPAFARRRIFNHDL
jgi:spermidine synthase